MDEYQGPFERGEPSYQQSQQPAGQQLPQEQQFSQQYPQGQQLQPYQGQPQQPQQRLPQQAQPAQQPSQQPPQQPVAQSPPPVQPQQQTQPAVGQQPAGQAQQPQQQPQMPSQQQQIQQPAMGQQPATQEEYSQQQPRSQQGIPATQQTTRQQLRRDTVTDILQTDVVTADPETPLSTVVEQMERNGVGSVIVVDNKKPVGILTDRKIALALSDFADLSGQQAGDLLGDEIVVSERDTSLFEAIDHLNEHNIRRLPIVDDSGSLAGIVTLDDILVALAGKFNDATAIIESQLSRP